MGRVIIQLLIVAILNAIGQVSLKIGADSIEPLPENLFKLHELLKSPYLILGGVFYIFSLILYIEALSKTRLSVAYPFIGSTFILVVVLGVVVLDEPYNLRIIFGTLLIFIGVSLVGFGLPSS